MSNPFPNDPLQNLADQTRLHARAAADLPIDPDLEWVDRQIREVEDQPHNPFMERDPSAMERRNEYLRRLRAIRQRLTQGDLP